MAFGQPWLGSKLYNIKLIDNNVCDYVTAIRFKVDEVKDNTIGNTMADAIALLHGLKTNSLYVAFMRKYTNVKADKTTFETACAKLTQLEHYLTLDLSIVKGEPAANLVTHQECDKEHTSGYNKSISKQCKYCKKYGHSVDTCKKLLFKKKAQEHNAVDSKVEDKVDSDYYNGSIYTITSISTSTKANTHESSIKDIIIDSGSYL
jgi:hypothetical protein